METKLENSQYQHLLERIEVLEKKVENSEELDIKTKTIIDKRLANLEFEDSKKVNNFLNS